MNFTREPIIETIITPRDGYRLLLRSSKAADREEHSVEAVEVVSFGHSFFYRSLERSKPFLIPLSDYELVEHREVRMQLHNAAPDRAIKISGGRQPARDSSEGYEDESAPAGDSQGRRESGKRRPRRRRSGRGGDRPTQPSSQQQAGEPQHDAQDQSEGEFDQSYEAPPAAPLPPPMARLIPPPTTLIKETIGRYKTTDEFSPPPFSPHEGREEATKENSADDNDLL